MYVVVYMQKPCTLQSVVCRTNVFTNQGSQPAAHVAVRYPFPELCGHAYVVSCYRQGPRVIVRNFAVATTSACVLVYPELVLGIMPRCFARVQQKVAERRAQ